MEAYTHLSDSIMHQILASTDDKLKAARAWLEDIQKRKVYKLIVETPPIMIKDEDRLKYKVIVSLTKIKQQNDKQSCFPYN